MRISNIRKNWKQGCLLVWCLRRIPQRDWSKRSIKLACFPKISISFTKITSCYDDSFDKNLVLRCSIERLFLKRCVLLFWMVNQMWIANISINFIMHLESKENFHHPSFLWTWFFQVESQMHCICYIIPCLPDLLSFSSHTPHTCEFLSWIPWLIQNLSSDIWIISNSTILKYISIFGYHLTFQK